METWDAIRSRRNVREYSDRPIAEADLDRILEAGWRSPSASNGQRRDFVLCTDPVELVALAGVSSYAAHVATSAATIALVVPAVASVEIHDLDWYDLGQATMAMMIAAADLGIGSGHASVGDQDLVRRLLRLPEDRLCAYLMAMGYPADRPLAPVSKPKRRRIYEVVHRDRW